MSWRTSRSAGGVEAQDADEAVPSAAAARETGRTGRRGGRGRSGSGGDPGAGQGAGRPGAAQGRGNPAHVAAPHRSLPLRMGAGGRRRGRGARGQGHQAGARPRRGTGAGGAPELAVRAAAAVELVHNFTLLHDDVMDRDTTRRHRPTAWTVFGDAGAILAGDALQALAQRLLAEDPHPAARPAAARIAACVMELCEGQVADVALERREPDQVTLDECLVMAEAKTGALLGCACAVGGLYAGAGEEEVAALDGFGRQAGLAFQLIDDVMGIWGIRPVRARRQAPISRCARSHCRWWRRWPRARPKPVNWPRSTGWWARRTARRRRGSWRPWQWSSSAPGARLGAAARGGPDVPGGAPAVQGGPGTGGRGRTAVAGGVRDAA